MCNYNSCKEERYVTFAFVVTRTEKNTVSQNEMKMSDSEQK